MALTHTYRYAAPSALLSADRPVLSLATSGGAGEHPYFFEGQLRQPREAAQLLLGVSRVVAARYYTPPAMLARILALADPVVTSGGGWLRFEGFSACASAYARADLSPEAYDGDVVSTGTTNVDFNPPMRAALTAVRHGERLGLGVGRDEVRLSREAGAVVERKVPLPLRWLKGFVEVQAYQARLGPRLTLSRMEATRFLRELPRTSTARHALWVGRSGRSLRTSVVEQPGGIRLVGAERLRVLEVLVPLARELRVYGSDDAHPTAWELDLGASRFTLVLSGEVWRGFSGEGQVLEALASGRADGVVGRLRAALRWQACLDLDALAQALQADRADLASAAAVLGSHGLVGYDLGLGAWYHRELPFDRGRVEAMHPRLVEARALVAGGGVRVASRGPDALEVEVPGSGVTHRVRLADDGDRCTCPWYAKHRGDRGPCKHVLAAHLVTEEE